MNSDAAGVKKHRRRRRRRVAQPETAERTAAALTLQSIFRAKKARQLYSLPTLPTNKAMDYQIRIIGNDPDFEGLSQHKVTNEKIAIIGTSGLKVLDIAFELSDLVITPKIIIVDNSIKVIQFWRSLRDFVNQDIEWGSDFPEQLTHFIHSISETPHFNNNSPIDEPLKALINKIGRDHFIAMVKHSTIILQDWSDAVTFIKLKNILKLHGIEKTYLYPSNIVSFTSNAAKRDLILTNIETFNPTLSLQTNYSIKKKRPTESFIFTTNNKEVNSQLLIPPSTLHFLNRGSTSTASSSTSTTSMTNK